MDYYRVLQGLLIPILFLNVRSSDSYQKSVIMRLLGSMPSKEML